MSIKAGEIASKVKSSSGSRKREAVLASNSYFIVNAGETISAKDLLNEIEFLNEEVLEWQDKLCGAQDDISRLKIELSTYNSSQKNKSRKVSELGNRQRRRKIISISIICGRSTLVC